MKQIDRGDDGKRHAAVADGCKRTMRVTRLPLELCCLQFLVQFRTPLRVNRDEETSFNFSLTSGQGMKAVLEWRCRNCLGPDPSMKHKGSDWLRLLFFNRELTEKRGKCCPRAHEPNRGEVRDAVLISFDETTEG